MHNDEATGPVEEIPKGVTDSLGRTLREAREARRLSLENASELLRIEPKFLVALEEERFDAIGPPVFVKGYLRHYCELLGLDAQVLIDAHRDELVRHEPNVRARRSVGHDRERHVAVWALGAAGAGLAVALFWAVGVPLLGTFEDAPASVTSDVGLDGTAASFARPGSPSGNAEGGSPAEGRPADRAEQASVPSRSDARLLGSSVTAAGPDAAATEDAAAGASDGAATGGAEPAAIDGAAASARSGEAPIEFGSGEGSIPRQRREPAGSADQLAAGQSGLQGVEDPADAEPLASRERALTAAGGAQDRSNAAVSAAALEIELRFIEDSWTEVTSADDERLYYGLARAGAEERVSAEAPVTVLLGNADGVVLRVNGELFSYPRGSRRGELARFTLSPPQD